MLASGRIFSFALLLIVSGAIVFWSWRTKKTGKMPHLRKIAGLEALDEAVGRATELGRPVFFTTGWTSDSGKLWSATGPALIAAVNILNHVTRIAARKGAKVIAAVCGSEMVPVIEESMRMAYVKEGKPDLYKAENVYYYAEQSFTIATVSLMKDQQVGSGVYAGAFGHDALILGETGYILGAFQVAASTGNLPFLLATCDYVLVGEELLAAGALLSKEPVLVGGLVGEDFGKVVALIILLVGVALLTVGSKLIPDLMNM